MKRLALVTGAASGIGAEVALRLARRGFTVICVDRNAELAALAADATAADAIAVDCDHSNPESVAALCARIRDEWALEVVVCNAGIITPGDVVELNPQVIDRHLDIMLRAPMQLITASVPAMMSRRSGHVLATVSLGGIVAMPGSAAYSAAKFGMRAFLAALYAEVSEAGVKVSGIYPSGVDTPMLRAEAAAGGSALNFVGEVRSIDDVADAYERALDTGKLELYVPYLDSLTSRLVSIKPSLVPRLVPTLNRIGERGRAKYLASPEPN